MDQDQESAEYELQKKSPALAAFISFLLPGTGQMYGKKIGKGIIWMYNFNLLKSLSSP